MDNKVWAVLALVAVVAVLKAFEKFLDWRETWGRPKKTPRPGNAVPDPPSPSSAESSGADDLAQERWRAVQMAKMRLGQPAPTKTAQWVEPDPIRKIIVPEEPKRMQELLETLARDAVIFLKREPTPGRAAHLSFFGGRPIVPPGWAWPRSWETGYPLSFVLQVDLSMMPDNDVGRGLPDSGVLYFFFDPTATKSDILGCVDYRPGPVEGWAEAVPPADIPKTKTYSARSDPKNGETSAFPKTEVLLAGIKDFPERSLDVSEELRLDPGYADRPYDPWEDQLWTDTVAALARKERGRVEKTFGAPWIGSYRHQMGGYPYVLQNGMDYGSPVPPLLKLWGDQDLDINFASVTQFWFRGRWNRDWDTVYMNREFD